MLTMSYLAYSIFRNQNENNIQAAADGLSKWTKDNLMKLNIEKTQQMTLNPQIETIKNTEQLNYNDKGRIKCDMCEKTLINLRGYNIH